MAARAIGLTAAAELAGVRVRVTVRAIAPERALPGPSAGLRIDDGCVTGRTLEFEVSSVQRESRPELVVELRVLGAERRLHVATSTAGFAAVHLWNAGLRIEGSLVRVLVARLAPDQLAEELADTAESTPTLVRCVAALVASFASGVRVSTIEPHARPPLVIERSGVDVAELRGQVTLRARVGLNLTRRQLFLEVTAVRVQVAVLASPGRRSESTYFSARLRVAIRAVESRVRMLQGESGLGVLFDAERRGGKVRPLVTVQAALATERAVVKLAFVHVRVAGRAVVRQAPGMPFFERRERGIVALGTAQTVVRLGQGEAREAVRANGDRRLGHGEGRNGLGVVTLGTARPRVHGLGPCERVEERARMGRFVAIGTLSRAPVTCGSERFERVRVALGVTRSTIVDRVDA